MKLTPEDVRRAQTHAEESVLRAKPLVEGPAPNGARFVVARGPLFPAEGPSGDLLPDSTQRAYLIYWYGRPGSEYPSQVNEYVLLRGESPSKGFKHRLQVWAVGDTDQAASIVKEAFGVDVMLLPEESK